MLESEKLKLVAIYLIPTKLVFFFRMNFILSFPPDYEINKGFLKLKATVTELLFALVTVQLNA